VFLYDRTFIKERKGGLVKLALNQLSIAYPDWSMENCSLTIPHGTFTAVVGPSGSGKTTLLRLIAGLEKPATGTIFLDTENVTHVSAEHRNIGFVFQGDALFSHLDVFDNVAFGLKMHNASQIQEKVSKALSLVHLTGFEKRAVNTLSGGEKKRVAIARAIAFNPNVLLLDEPLNGLDAQLKEKMKVFLKKLQEKTGLAMILVTHDLDDAFFLSDQLVVMNNGKIEQTGTPSDLFFSPKNVFVKNFFSDYVLVQGKESTSGSKTMVEGRFSFPVKKGKGTPYVNFKKTNYKFIEDL
jgi:ABC-type Fe3+/spermidine/putrescine transport system ATPase subunit